MPDFGYGADNYLLDFHDRPRNWALILNIISEHDRYGWLQNFIKL